MVNPKIIIRVARKWQKAAALQGRKRRISLPRTKNSSSMVAEKGHFVIYTMDQKRFAFPIQYLRSYIFKELFDMSEEEFGLPRDGPIKLPCDGAFMEYAVSLIQRQVDREVEEALVLSIGPPKCSVYSLFYNVAETNQHVMVCGF